MRESTLLTPLAARPEPAPDQEDGEGGFPGSWIAWTTVWILVAICILAWMDRQILSLLVEPIRKYLGVTDFQIGLLQGLAFGAFYAIFGLPMGWLVDRFQRRQTIYAGVTLWSIATAACGLANSFFHLFVARFAVGVGEATLMPAAWSMISDLFPKRRLAFAIGVFSTGAAIGPALALVLGGFLIGHLETHGAWVLPVVGALQPWQMVFLIAGLPGLFLALLIFLVPEPIRRHRLAETQVAAGPRPSLAQFLSRRKWFYTCHFCAFGFLAVATLGSGAWLPTFLLRRYHLGIGEVGLLLGALNFSAAFPGYIFNGWFVDRWFAAGCKDAHFRYFVYTCLGGGAMAVATFCYVPSLWLFCVLWYVIHFVPNLTGPAAAALHLTTPNEFRGRISALFVGVYNLIGMVLGPPSIAFFTQYVFRDPAKLNFSIAVIYGVFMAIAATFFTLGLKPLRKAIAEMETPAAP